MRVVISGAVVLAALAAPAQAADKTVIAGNWWDSSVTDPITDVRRGIVYADSADQKASVVLKCDRSGPGTVYATIITGQYLGEGRSKYRNLIYRFDDRAPVESRWGHDSSYAFNFEPEAFVSAMRGSSKLVVRATAYDYSNVDVIFDVTGADQAIQRVYEACGDTAPA